MSRRRSSRPADVHGFGPEDARDDESRVRGDAMGMILSG